MKFKTVFFVFLMVAILLLSACQPPQQTGETIVSTESATAPSENPTKEINHSEPLSNGELRKQGSDYTYFWWDFGVVTSKRNAYVQTGNYGFMMDGIAAKIKKLGGVTGIPRDDVASGTNQSVDQLPNVKNTSYNIAYDDIKTYAYTTSYVHNEKFPMSEDWQEGPGKTNAFRIINGGTYMQRFDVMQLLYKNNDDITGRVEYSCVSDYFTVTYDAKLVNDRKKDVELSYTLELDKSYNIKKVYNNGKAMILRREDGQCVAFIIPEDTNATLSSDGTAVTFTANVTVYNNKWEGFSFVIMPGLELGENCILDYYASRKVTIEAENTEPKAGKAAVEYNKIMGAYDITMPNSTGFTDFTVEENKTAYDRTSFTVTNDSDRDVRVTLNFKKREVHPTPYYGLWGMSPMIVDPETNEPTGMGMQYSRNPHGYTSFTEVLYGACWVNIITYIDVPANSSVSYDFVCAYSCWGETYASSIAQMCLVGWGGNQWWMSASLNSSPGYGELFGFDPDRGCSRALIDDSSPFFTNGGRGAGGADWLTVYDKVVGYRHVRNQKITVKSSGPNVSRMTVSGYLETGSVYAELTVTISRSNDFSRVLNTFHYEFLEDVEFARMALYQLGADNYNDTRFEKLAYGDSTGTFEVLDVPANGTKSEYIKQYVDMTGENVWISQYSFDPERVDSNKGLVIREYKATLNGKTYDYPTLGFYITNNGVTNLNGEITLPEEVDKNGKVQKGSVVDGVVEYIILPKDKNDYYGTSEYINAQAAELFVNEGLMSRFAVDAAIKETVSVGELVGTYPTRVKTVKGDVLAEVTITGGIGYVPVTFIGIEGYSGYRLFEVMADGSEVMVDQSVRGNDYWQVYYDPDTRLCDISFNVYQLDGKPHTYRLKKVQ